MVQRMRFLIALPFSPETNPKTNKIRFVDNILGQRQIDL